MSWMPRQMSSLILKHALASRPFGQWRDDDYDVLENGVVGRPHLLPRCSRAAGPSLDVESGHQTATSNAPACGYEPTREAAMAGFAKSWRRG